MRESARVIAVEGEITLSIGVKGDSTKQWCLIDNDEEYPDGNPCDKSSVCKYWNWEKMGSCLTSKRKRNVDARIAIR